MKKVTGWGHYPVSQADIMNLKTEEEIRHFLLRHKGSVIARGLGRSYGDTAQNKGGHILQINHHKTFVAKDGLLLSGGGASLSAIMSSIVPKGYCLPVTPGTKYVTIGGAIANDVHGKNHVRDGSIAQHLLSFRLMIANGEILTCSRTTHPELFWATIGGIGTTGIILDATIQLIPIETAYMSVTYEKANNLHELLEKFQGVEKHYQHNVAWIDCVSTGKHVGRSILMKANHVSQKELPLPYQKSPLHYKTKPTLTMPFYAPSGLLNTTTVKWFNDVYYWKYKNEQTYQHVDDYFYPLDRVHHWNRGYGKKGFLQYQMVFPFHTAQEGIHSILNKLASYKQASFLGVLKVYGPESGGYLSFPMEGYGLALDIPISNKNVFDLCKELDEITLNYKGRTYLAKDAQMTPETFHKMYGESIEKWKAVKNDVDPHHLFSSSMTRRLGLT